MKVLKMEKQEFESDFKSKFNVEFPDDILPEAEMYDFALVGIGQRKRAVSFVTIQKTSEQTAYICFGAVTPSLRAKGFGRKSLTLFTEFLFKSGFKEVKFATHTQNTEMRAAGISAGFRPLGKREHRGRNFREFSKVRE